MNNLNQHKFDLEERTTKFAKRVIICAKCCQEIL